MLYIYTVMFDTIHIHINDDALTEINKQIKAINQKLNSIMATIQQLSAQVDELQAALDSEQQQVRDAIAALETAVRDLEALVADGGTEEERQALADKLTAVKEDLEGTIPDATEDDEEEVPPTE